MILSIRKTIFFGLLASWLCLAWSAPVLAASPSPARVALLVSSERAPFREATEGVRELLQGKAGGVDLSIHTLVGTEEEAMAVVAKVKKGKPDLILALGTAALNAACAQRGDVPIVAGMVLDRRDIPRQRNVGGVVLDIPLQTQMEWMRRMFPKMLNVGVLYNSAENGEGVAAASEIAATYGFRVVPRQVDDPQDLPEALERLAKEADVLWGISDRVVLTPQTAKSILLFSFRNRIPFVGLSRAWVKAGALYALDRDYRDIGRQCGELALRALQGQAPEGLPVESPRKITYSLNLKTARKMKIGLPPSLVDGAQETF
ncbi:MAG: hypothetical protein C0617_12700 [Desulfuromonas sp.]|uniref:ABC transporter substrate-binding protein n=1 Tax=Desulfuromonas sp. TaxID=892 RepID=UPI000CC252C3|nr:ABC transporter substrate-binding protein [Desulfuromonas sp.]PLX83372.1 MAG: hypothetical protein C0617_12700 [Desulfuromonas sp.]